MSVINWRSGSSPASVAVDATGKVLYVVKAGKYAYAPRADRKGTVVFERVK